MIIDPKELSEDALNGLLESFISRDGTDYGEHELSLQRKLETLKQQVLSKSAFIVFDSVNNEFNILSKLEFEGLNH